MKWYFACNDKSERFYPLILAAVESAFENTTLTPCLIFDGEENDLTRTLRGKGVEIIFHRVSFYDDLKSFYDEAALNIASGAFLRCDIPIIEKEDDFVLYTDCDVLFLKDFDFSSLKHPDYFACAPQTNRRNYFDFNTGVMVMNVKNLRESHEKFVKFIKNNLKKFSAYDQSAYQIFYNVKNTKLPPKFNHKPYWGIDNDAVIVHFHGGKPVDFSNEEVLKRFPREYVSFYRKNPEAYRYYLELFSEYYPEIEYSKEGFKKLESGEYPLVMPQKNSFWKRIKSRVEKSFAQIIKK